MKCPVMGVRQSLWSEKEHELMFRYLGERKDDLMNHIYAVISSDQRYNKSHFFIEMSKYIKTKSDVQCKSRYQKKEGILLEALKIPQDVLKDYNEARKMKVNLAKSGQRASTMTRTTQEGSKKPMESNIQTISSYSGLKKAMREELIPKIANIELKNQMIRFIDHLPHDGDHFVEISSFNVNSMSFIKPKTNKHIKKKKFSGPDSKSN